MFEEACRKKEAELPGKVYISGSRLSTQSYISNYSRFEKKQTSDSWGFSAIDKARKAVLGTNLGLKEQTPDSLWLSAADKAYKVS